MPVNKAAKFRFDILDECFRNTKRKWTKNDLLNYVNRRLRNHYGEDTSISLSQLRYDIGNMQSECGAPIEMYREGKNYYYKYEDSDFSIKSIPIEKDDLHVLSQALSIIQQIKGFTVADEMAEVLKKLKNKFDFEIALESNVISFDHTARTDGDKNLQIIYQSILQKVALRILYRGFKAQTDSSYNVHPYLLKEFNGRWYLLAFCQEKSNTRIYALDRIKAVKLSEESFHVNILENADDFFKDVIGVTILQNQVKEIIELIYSSDLAPYIKSQKIHDSQKILDEYENGELHIELDVVINPELIRLILSHGKDVTVLKPAILIQEIKRVANELANRYAL